MHEDMENHLKDDLIHQQIEINQEKSADKHFLHQHALILLRAHKLRAEIIASLMRKGYSKKDSENAVNELKPIRKHGFFAYLKLLAVLLIIFALAGLTYVFIIQEIFGGTYQVNGCGINSKEISIQGGVIFKTSVLSELESIKNASCGSYVTIGNNVNHLQESLGNEYNKNGTLQLSTSLTNQQRIAYLVYGSCMLESSKRNYSKNSSYTCGINALNTLERMNFSKQEIRRVRNDLERRKIFDVFALEEVRIV